MPRKAKKQSVRVFHVEHSQNGKSLKIRYLDQTLWYRVAKSSRPDANARRVAVFLSGPITVIPFDESDSRRAGAIRATLESSGKAIGAYDLLIAAQAMARELTLVTGNAKEFSRVKGLQWEDWARNL